MTFGPPDRRDHSDYWLGLGELRRRSRPAFEMASYCRPHYLLQQPPASSSMRFLLGDSCSPPESVNPNRDSPNGYPTVTPTELQPVTLAH